MISSQDFERLSAYLDNQLSLKEKTALEARLAREPELRATLDSLRQTVRALRSLPVVKPPRNFRLTARQVGVAPQRRFFPIFRLATSMAALALMLVFAGDFIAGRTPALSPAAPVRNSTVERSMIPSEVAPPAAAVGAAPAPTLALTQVMDQSPVGTPALGGGATGGPAVTPAPEANTPLAAAVLAASPATSDTTASASAPAPAAAPAGAQPTAIISEPAAAARLAPTETPAGEPPAATASEPAAAAKSAQTEAPSGEPPTALASEPPAATQPAPAEASAPFAPAETAASPAASTVSTYLSQTPETAAAPVSGPGSPWRSVEIGLIGLTLILAVMTWLMRRR